MEINDDAVGAVVVICKQLRFKNNLRRVLEFEINRNYIRKYYNIMQSVKYYKLVLPCLCVRY